MTDLTQRLRELAEALVGCEWELPLCSRETCLRSADEIERLNKRVMDLEGECGHLQADRAEQKAEIERLTTESGYWERIARQQIGENEQLTREITRLRGVCNLLADKLSIYTGYPIPTEVREAESAEAAGADRWNPSSCCYVDDGGHEAAGGE